MNANSATTFENPTALTNWLSIYLLLAIPFALTYTFGKMVGSVRHGAALLAAMVVIFGVWVGFTSYAEHQNNPAIVAAGVHSTVGNTEGKQAQFGDTTTGIVRLSRRPALRRGLLTPLMTSSTRSVGSGFSAE